MTGFWHWAGVLFILSLGVGDRRMEEGYPRGLMPVCPGSTKPASIPRSQLKHLFFVVQGKGGSRKKYTYWSAKNIATDPRMDLNRRTIVVAIGYLDSTNFPISNMFAREYKARGYNVILIDNQRFATVHYFLASRLMRPVGFHVAEVLAQLTQSGLESSKLELIGFSLGAHTASYIAKNYRLLSGKNISRIYALEPAGPCFRDLDKDDRLDASDADFVQVIHTNIDGFGMATRMGHLDLYVNGGEYQPSDLSLFPCTTTCSHFKVLLYWLSAMRNPGSFIAIKCDTIQHARDGKCFDRVPLETNLMGLKANESRPGIFYLSTDKHYPFHLGMRGLEEEYVAWRRISDVNDNTDTEIYV